MWWRIPYCPPCYWISGMIISSFVSTKDSCCTFTYINNLLLLPAFGHIFTWIKWGYRWMEAILTFRTYKQVCCPPLLLVLISCFPTITHLINVSWFFMLSVVRYNSWILVKLSYSYLPWKIFKSTCQTTIDQMNGSLGFSLGLYALYIYSTYRRATSACHALNYQRNGVIYR